MPASVIRAELGIRTQNGVSNWFNATVKNVHVQDTVDKHLAKDPRDNQTIPDDIAILEVSLRAIKISLLFLDL